MKRNKLHANKIQSGEGVHSPQSSNLTFHRENNGTDVFAMARFVDVCC